MLTFTNAALAQSTCFGMNTKLFVIWSDTLVHSLTFFLLQFIKSNTFFSLLRSVQILYERGMISMELQQIFKSVLSNAMREALLPESQFWSADRALKTLSEKYYNVNNDAKWPEVIKLTQDPADHLGLTPKQNYRLALKAVGACVWYLTKCVIDEQIMSMAHYKWYIPPDIEPSQLDETIAAMATANMNKHMVLDSITLSNLKIVNDERSLYNVLDQCCTKFGKRLLNYWVCSPSCERSVIVERQEAIQEFMENTELLSNMRMIFGTLPDLERQLAQIHTFGNKNRVLNHPDGRAVLFEQKQYNKKKIGVRL